MLKPKTPPAPRIEDKESLVNSGRQKTLIESPGAFINVHKAKASFEALARLQLQMNSIVVAASFKPLFRPARYKVFYGGRGGGKSWAIARALLVISLQKQVRILCAREFQTSIEDSVMSLLVDQINQLGLGRWFKVQKKGIVCTLTGSEFKFAGLRHNVTEIKSFEGVDICWVEEAQRVSEESWMVLIPTIRKAGSEIWVSFNPGESSDATYQRFVLNPPDDSVVVKVNWNHNPWFSEVLNLERQHMLKTDPDAYDWVWNGNCRKISDAVIFRGKFSIERFETPSDVEIFYFGADWGFGSDPTALNRAWIKDNHLYLDYEAHALGLELNDVPDLFDTVPGSRIWPIEADSSQPQTIRHVAGFGFNVRSAPKWPGSVQDGITHLRGYEQIHVHERCHYTGQEFMLYSYKTDTAGNPLPVIIDRHNHHIDDIRYALGPRIRGSHRQIMSASQARRLRNGF